MGLLLHYSVNVCVHMCPHGQPGVGCAPCGAQRPLCTGSHTLFLGRWAAGEGVRAGGRAGGWVGGWPSGRAGRRVGALMWAAWCGVYTLWPSTGPLHWQPRCTSWRLSWPTRVSKSGGATAARWRWSVRAGRAERLQQDFEFRLALLQSVQCDVRVWLSHTAKCSVQPMLAALSAHPL
jgi:hypothetical protein